MKFTAMALLIFLVLTGVNAQENDFDDYYDIPAADDSDEITITITSDQIERLLDLMENSGRRRTRSGTWHVSGQASLEGYLDMTKDDNKENATVNWERPGDRSDLISGTLDLTYQNETRSGSIFTSQVGVDYASGLSGALIWERTIFDGDFNAGVYFNQNNWWGAKGWPAIIISSGYDTGKFGLTVAGKNEFWTEAKLTEWVLLFFRRQPALDSWDYRNNLQYQSPALEIYELTGYYQAFNDQFRIDLAYKQHPWREYRDYFRASSIVARNWNAGDQTIGFSYRPAFLDDQLNIGVAFTNIGMTELTAAPPHPIDVIHSTKRDTKGNPPLYGALSRVVIGAIYDMGNMQFSAMVNTGNTGGSGWWFLTKDPDDKDMEDGYFDLLGASNWYAPIRAEVGFNLGARAVFGDLTVNGDMEIVGFDDFSLQGMMAAGINGTYRFNDLTTGLTARLFHYLGQPSTLYIEGGLLGFHPSISYSLVPNILTAALRIDYVTGITGSAISSFQFLKLNPRLQWTVNADARTFIELGYTFRYDFNDFRQVVMENAINLRFMWRF